MFKMITIQPSKFDILNIETELNLKAGGVKELASKVVLEELASAIFTVSGKSFIKALNLEAKGNPMRYHHIYEWNQVGSQTGRLFFIYKQSSLDGKLTIKPGFIKSKTKVPVSPELLTPGKTGKSVASRHVFRDKASIMENGTPIIFRTSKNTPMPIGGQIKFVAANTVIRNYNPGGRQVKGSFEKYFNYWFQNKVNAVINSSGIIEKIDMEVAKTLNKNKAGPLEVRTAIINLLKQYSKGQEVL